MSLDFFKNLSPEEAVMLIVGFAVQAMFTMRFLVQWLKS